MEQLPLGVRLRDRASFETFQPGANLEALRHLEELADGRPGIVWLWGPCGSGRTHLLQAASARAAARTRSACLSCPELHGGGAAALLGWQGFGLLALDDIDALIGDAAFERALFSMFQDTQERGAVLVTAAVSAPAALRWSLADLGSRFGGSAVFQLRPLDDEDQVAALRRRASARGLELPEETARYLQRRMPRDMTSLCGVLDALDSASLAAQRRITVPFIRAVLGEP
ncbi:MAG: DnaA regulatory inactivator Hda [Steroidobacteraceae bacterium]|nr:DnaA regulatory inactivator Hda [Nevskiaceae bacterium]MCP5339027.1 DnaA regulatory inactivator Hda [Nevskiaceae bacterium]MCP5359561.1 DnaA regulatory inactivator Hda [Nevskiaceae bacterium]MCP5473039.1 DnaA regulatory inactivator Hda [Nevskiaceae bacterium]